VPPPFRRPAGSIIVRLDARLRDHVASIFGKLGLPPSGGDNRRVLAVLRYLGG